MVPRLVPLARYKRPKKYKAWKASSVLCNQGLTAKYTFSDIICESTIMKEIIERARIPYTQCDSTILLEGETGTGKEVFAQSIHNESPRRHGLLWKTVPPDRNTS